MVIFLKFFSIFSGFFKIINENSQLSIIKSIYKDISGFTLIEIGPVNQETSTVLDPYALWSKKIFKSQLRKSDIRIIKAIIISEGDVFITSKNYSEDGEVMVLESVLDKTRWEMTKSDVIENQEVLSRLNKKYLNFSIK